MKEITKEMEEEVERICRHIKYEVYLKSREWRNLRRYKLIKADWRCEECGCETGELHIHHKTYERLYNERVDDLQVLCKACHLKKHGGKFTKGELDGLEEKFS